MSDLPQPPIPPSGMQRFLMGGTTPETFANQLRMGVTVTDFTLIFGVGADGGTSPPMLIDKAIIHVSPGMLKQMVQNLTMAVAAYEEVMGEIRVPKPLAAHLAGLKTHLVTLLRHQMEGPQVPNE